LNNGFPGQKTALFVDPRRLIQWTMNCFWTNQSFGTRDGDWI